MKLNNRGFTLVEVLAVIIILAIIASIAIPNVLSTINSSKDRSYDIMIKNIITASKALFEEVEYGGELHKYTIDDTQIDNEDETSETSETISSSTITEEELIIEEDPTSIKITTDSNNNGSNNIESKSIKINLQTLVSNGFLSGTCYNNEEENCKKVIINPKTGNDIGNCNIIIKKQKQQDSGKVTYSVSAEESELEDCPETEDYNKGLN